MGGIGVGHVVGQHLGPLGAEVRGFDPCAPLDAASVKAINDAFLDHLVLRFRGHALMQALEALALEGVIDLDAERSRITKAIEAATKERDALAARLSNAAFVEKAVAWVKGLKLGNPFDAASTLGPMANKRFAAVVRGQIAEYKNWCELA